MPNRFFFAMSLMAIIGLTTFSLAQRAAPRKSAGLNWQAGQIVNVQLLVRDKDRILGPYDASFIVVSPGGKQWKASKHTKGGEAQAFFPEDFDLAAATTGKYTWKCMVKGEVVIEGEFDYVENNAVTGATADQLRLKFR